MLDGMMCSACCCPSPVPTFHNLMHGYAACISWILVNPASHFRCHYIMLHGAALPSVQENLVVSLQASCMVSCPPVQPTFHLFVACLLVPIDISKLGAWADYLCCKKELVHIMFHGAASASVWENLVCIYKHLAWCLVHQCNPILIILLTVWFQLTYLNMGFGPCFSAARRSWCV
jgi:hypothetical protein